LGHTFLKYLDSWSAVISFKQSKSNSDNKFLILGKIGKTLKVNCVFKPFFLAHTDLTAKLKRIDYAKQNSLL